MRTNHAKARKAKARNFGDEAALVRAMDCIVHTAATTSHLSDEGLVKILGWTACGGAACAHHAEPRQMGGAGEGRMRLYPGCARHGEEAGESSFLRGRSSKRTRFELLYNVDVGAIADAIALAHPPPLGIRGLAARFAWWHEHEHLGAVVELEATFEPPERLVGYDLAALMGWVRRHLESTWERTLAEDGCATAPDNILPEALGITMAQARALFDAADAGYAGWPS